MQRKTGISELCLQDPQPVDGILSSDRKNQGLGIELNDAVVMRSPHVVIK